MLLQLQEIQNFYQNYLQKVTAVKHTLQRPLTLSEKILFAHQTEKSGNGGKQQVVRENTASITLPLVTSTTSLAQRGKSTLSLNVDRVAMQDATAQMAILQFMLTGRKKVAVPTTVHCDHLIIAHSGAEKDLQQAHLENNEVYQFLKSAANKYGLGFWKPGSGIIHQVILENYAVPGQLMIGTDSHTPNAGGLGMIAIGVGGAEAVDALAGLAWQVQMPKLIGVHLKGKLSGWTAAKDVILKVAELLTVKGGTGYVLEYFGEGARSLSATGKATITNMGAEVGATTSIFPYDERTAEYLRATQRGFVAEMVEQEKIKSELQADPEVERHPEKFFDKVIEILLDTLEPHIVGPHTPDLARPISKVAEDVQKNNWPAELSACLIGSCTNSSYEDMTRAASIARQAAEKGLKVKVPFFITPGSEQIYHTLQRDGLVQVFENIGGKVLANACGPCIGQWKRQEVKTGQKNSIVTSYNRNFKGRNDENSETHAFIASPEVVTAFALMGRLDANPLAVLQPPQGEQLPEQGFVFSSSGYEAPSNSGDVLINPQSERLAFLEPFGAWKENDFQNLSVLLKVKGKCTTDHISPAGKWLKYRGHLDKISDNMFSGALNVFTGEVGKGKNILSGEKAELSKIARAYKMANRGWVVVGDENYGEGSSREHAAMEPRYLGCRAVLAKSFARIAETNLKQQGVLPLWFVDALSYEKIQQEDEVSLVVEDLVVEQEVYIQLNHVDGSQETFPMKHTLTAEQIEWWKAGSKLEWIRKNSF